VSGGRNADVPAGNGILWMVMRKPLGVGPYVISRWEYRKKWSSPQILSTIQAPATNIVALPVATEQVIAARSQAKRMVWDVASNEEQIPPLLEAQAAGKVRCSSPKHMRTCSLFAK
jgi:hypothetical protein